ncbi:fumarylacetoacetate hydrolase family protein [Nocardia abscessus]|uniref:fumarylacetoacetate hydrolase family protein n=2 Tax=Nocardia abscessus TaxID=120957 RepID=UPI00313B79B4
MAMNRLIHTRSAAPAPPLAATSRSPQDRRRPASICPSCCLRRPPHVDFEGEIAVVLGHTVKNVGTHSDAWACAAGLTVLNDVTARDVQRRAYAGDLVASIGVAKSFDTFKPLGPCLGDRRRVHPAAGSSQPHLGERRAAAG